MTASVAQKLESFAVALRSRRHRAALLVLLGWLLLAQTLLAVHTVDHAKVENGAPCALCMAGDHLAGTVRAARASHPAAGARGRRVDRQRFHRRRIPRGLSIASSAGLPPVLTTNVQA